jgi:hypothetical protein
MATSKQKTKLKDKGKDKTKDTQEEEEEGDESLISLAQFGFEQFDNDDNLVQPQVRTRKRKQPDTIREQGSSSKDLNADSTKTRKLNENQGIANQSTAVNPNPPAAKPTAPLARTKGETIFALRAKYAAIARERLPKELYAWIEQIETTPVAEFLSYMKKVKAIYQLGHLKYQVDKILAQHKITPSHFGTTQEEANENFKFFYNSLEQFCNLVGYFETASK